MRTRFSLHLLALAPLGLVLTSPVTAAASMDNHVITAKAPVDATRYSGTVSVLTADDIRRSGATTLSRALQHLPGVYLSHTGNVSQQAPRIRGFSHEQTLVLIDGKRVPNTDRNLSFAPAYRYNWVPMSQVERIEVIRGPGSSLYGADAMAGVINIITKKASSQWQGNLNGSLGHLDGSHQNDDFGAALRGPLGDKADLSLSVSERNEDAIKDDNGASLTSDMRSRTLQADLGFDFNTDNRLELGLLYGEEKGGDIDISDFMGTTYTSDYRLDQTRRRLSADYLTRLGGFDFQAGASQGKADLTEGRSDWTIDEDNYQLELNGALGTSQHLNMGLQHRRETVSRSDMNFHEQVDATTLTLQDIIALTSEHSLTLGLAYDHHSKYDAEFSPKLYWNWQDDSGWGLRAGYGQSYLAPSLREGSSEYVIQAGPFRRYEGNDDLQPETNRTYELGLSYIQPDWRSKLTLFHNRIDNLISTREFQQGPVTVARYSNVNKAQTQGLEAEFDLNPTEHSRVSVNYTWLDSQNRSGPHDGKTLVDTPEHLFKVRLEHDLPRHDSTLYAAWRYTGSQYTNAINSDKLDAYQVVDLGLGTRLGAHAHMRFGINNLFDEVIEQGGELLEPGRELKLTLSADF
ncbi:TonB-dependent receptor plug domain-containing protein [Marinobacterium marinum]|uniref:TonB-dependent receptor n=1 Tax=Marinobacterium marinum TaxID=2756129 RepID=A0A7W1X043_9GAMM|nr:TonB-dependent receptor [Marinobacterium marinum]MBA4503435.1 TonB-dependent receptor [Marinobacterium marinum]